MYKKIARGSFNPPDHLSREANFFLNRMLVVDPCKRSNAHQLLEDNWLRGIRTESTTQNSEMFLSTNESSQHINQKEAWKKFE